MLYQRVSIRRSTVSVRARRVRATCPPHLNYRPMLTGSSFLRLLQPQLPQPIIGTGTSPPNPNPDPSPQVLRKLYTAYMAGRWRAKCTWQARLERLPALDPQASGGRWRPSTAGWPPRARRRGGGVGTPRRLGSAVRSATRAPPGPRRVATRSPIRGGGAWVGRVRMGAGMRDGTGAGGGNGCGHGAAAGSDLSRPAAAGSDLSRMAAAGSEGDLCGLPDGGGGVDAARGGALEEGVIDDAPQLLRHHGPCPSTARSAFRAAPPCACARGAAGFRGGRAAPTQSLRAQRRAARRGEQPPPPTRGSRRRFEAVE